MDRCAILSKQTRKQLRHILIESREKTKKKKLLSEDKSVLYIQAVLTSRDYKESEKTLFWGVNLAESSF